METVLTISHLKKQYDDLTVLKDISLTVREGEVIVIVGPSGCGKSTLLRCINALEEIQDGEILLDGNPISKKISQRTEDLIGMFHLESLQNRDIRTLSGGEQQRIAIARALLMDPDVILADEPTGNLDESNTNMIMDQFRNLTDQGKTVIMVTHDRSIADRADRIIEL